MVRRGSSSSTSKRRKRGGGRRKPKAKDEEDKISELPDAILCHILSFWPLTTKDAVKTSILSRRWRYVWTSVPCIVLDDNPTGWGDSKTLELKDCFADFVDKVLHLNELSFLRKFSLRCSEGCDSSRVNQWIGNALSRRGGIEEFHLSFYYHAELLPPGIFTSEKLVILKLECSGTLLDVPVSVYLPSLKFIHLDNVQLCNNVSMKNLLDGCPVLKELDINCVCHDYITMLIIRSPSLKSLKVCNEYSSIDDIEFGIVIETPNIERLDLEDALSEKFDVNYLCSLVEVTLDLYHRSPGSVGADVYGNRVVELLGKMSNTKYMNLSWDTRNSLHHARLDSLLTFHNLIDLGLDDDLDDIESSRQVLLYLLECSPNLISFCYGSFYNVPFQKPRCLMLNLEEIRLSGFVGCPNEMRWVRYFLKNAPVLKEISMWSSSSSSSSSKDESKILKKLSTLPRRSIACLIEFHSSITGSTIYL